MLRLEDGTVVQVEEFRGPPKASALPYIFHNAQVEVHCPGRTVRGWVLGRGAGQRGAPQRPLCVSQTC